MRVPEEVHNIDVSNPFDSCWLIIRGSRWRHVRAGQHHVLAARHGFDICMRIMQGRNQRLSP